MIAVVTPRAPCLPFMLIPLLCGWLPREDDRDVPDGSCSQVNAPHEPIDLCGLHDPTIVDDKSQMWYGP
jgi:hypothetical protein